MSTISASTTSTTAYKVTADTTGTLVFQTGASPTTAMTLGSDQSVTFAGTPTYSGGTANGVAYLNGSKVLTTGTALVFDGTNLGIGTTSPTAKLHVQGNSSISTSDWYASSATIRAQATSGNNTQAAIVLMSRGPTGSPAGASIHSQPVGSDNYRAGLVNTITGDGTGQAYWSVNNFNPTTASTSELCRVTYDGNLLVGTTTNGGTNKVVISAASSGSGNAALGIPGAATNYSKNIECGTGLLSSSYGVISFGVANPGNGYFLSFTAPDGGYNYAIRGTIALSGTSTAYNTSSDYRLKKDIAPMTGALAKVALLKPVTYKWLDDSEGEGFVAHELAEVVPQCVTGEKDAVEEIGNILDAQGEIVQEGVLEPETLEEGQNWVKTEDRPVYQGIDTSFLVAILTKAIQEQQAIIEQLRADVETLKGAE